MKSKLIRGSLTNTHVLKEDPRQRTADHSIVGIPPMARSKLLSAVLWTVK
jgi:hypothetical protein